MPQWSLKCNITLILIHLCHCSGLLSRFWWWSCAFSPFWDIWEYFPGFVSIYLGDNARSTSEAGVQWGWPWRDATLMTASCVFCWSSGRREASRLMLRWKVGAEGCDGVTFWGFGGITAAGLANGELRQSTRSAPIPGMGGFCCWGGVGYFRWAFFPLLIWATWG